MKPGSMAPGDMVKTRYFTSGYLDESPPPSTPTFTPIDSLGIVLSSPDDNCRVKWMLNGAVFWVKLAYLEEVLQ